MTNIGHELLIRWNDCDAGGSHNGVAVLKIQTLWNMTLRQLMRQFEGTMILKAISPNDTVLAYQLEHSAWKEVVEECFRTI